jgi:cell wall-associated NlpC family hydrolase
VTNVDVLISYLMGHIGVKYKWAGSNALMGFDCSGLLIEGFIAIGLVPAGFDATALGLYNYLSARSGSSYPLRAQPGSVCFYGKSKVQITHCGLALNETCMIEAGGGDRLVTTYSEAEARGALVRIRPIAYRKDHITTIQPLY